MKRITILLMVICLALFQNAYSKENTIYEIGVNKAQNGVTTLQLKSDFKEKISPIEESSTGFYFDIKNAKLSNSLKTNFVGDTGIVSQQIGSKVRIYINEDNTGNLSVVFTSDKKMPVNYWGLFLILSGIFFAVLVALKCCFVTIGMAKNSTSIKRPMKDAMNLNRKLYSYAERKSPEIVLNSTNTIKKDVYVDFQYAKDRKNIKIAI